MNVIFENEELKNLYEKGKSKKYRLNLDLVKKYIMRVDSLKASDLITDLWSIPALNFEKLQGEKNLYSVRINRKYRLEIRIEWNDVEKSSGTLFLINISNHYQ